jgi:organic hydroperoxide reductase OsmC/OhrA
MMGTLATVLAKKKIRTFQDRFQAAVVGDIEDVGGVLKITRISVSYRLKLPNKQAPDARAALDNYLHLCPAAQSVIDCIQITHELKLEEMASSPRGT